MDAEISFNQSLIEFKAKFDAKKITYEHRLIDDMVASALKWAAYVWKLVGMMGMFSRIRWRRVLVLGSDDERIVDAGWQYLSKPKLYAHGT